jgi:hypothetical protein
MRKICFGMLLGIFVAAHSYADTYQVKEKIKKVTVYKSSAQIQSDFNKIIKKGDHMMVAIEIPSTIIEESILIKSSNGVQVISIETKLTNLQEEDFAPKIKALKDSIADYSRAIDMEKIKKYAIDQEENLLLANMTFKSNSYTVVDIEELAELYKKRIPELKKESYRLEKSIAAMDKKKVSFQQELNQWRSGKNNKQLWSLNSDI